MVVPTDRVAECGLILDIAGPLRRIAVMSTGRSRRSGGGAVGVGDSVAVGDDVGVGDCVTTVGAVVAVGDDVDVGEGATVYPPPAQAARRSKVGTRMKLMRASFLINARYSNGKPPLFYWHGQSSHYINHTCKGQHHITNNGRERQLRISKAGFILQPKDYTNPQNKSQQ